MDGDGDRDPRWSTELSPQDFIIFKLFSMTVIAPFSFLKPTVFKRMVTHLEAFLSKSVSIVYL